MIALPDNDWLRSLKADLDNPPLVVNSREAADLHTIRTITFHCRAPKLLQTHPDLAIRLRGAWGAALHEFAPPHRRGEALPRPYDVMFAPITICDGHELPRPALIRTHTDGDTVLVELVLMGAAEVFVDEAVNAMLDALEAGIALDTGGRNRRPLEVFDVVEHVKAQLVVPDHTQHARLTFQTPLVIRQSGQTVITAKGIAAALLRRHRDVGRWQGILIEHVSEPEVQVRFEDWRVRWNRYSRRGGNRPIPTEGWLGIYDLSGAIDALAPSLLNGSLTNLGSRASLGFGHYQLHWV